MIIYGLKNPVTNEIRYVGATKNKLGERLRYHLKYARQEKHKSYLCYWIRKLLRSGIEPKIFLLEKVTKRNWAEKEKYWIKWLKDNDYRLTNWTDGGTGGDTRQGRPGKKHTQETKDLISRSKKNPSKETRLRISIANKSRKNHIDQMRAMTEKARLVTMIKKRKLTDAQVQEIKTRFKNGESGIKLASEYKVTRQTIDYTVKNKLKYLSEGTQNATSISAP